MYKVNREGTRVVISDWNGKIVYTADGDAIIVYKASNPDVLLSATVNGLTDEQLILALAKAIKLPL